MKPHNTLTLARALAAAALLSLAACGGGGGGGGSSGSATGSSSGTFSDAQVQGVAYTTSSGVRGVTDANGGFTFNPGDQVTFSLGGLTLGTTTASGLLTPLSLAGNDAVKLQNMLVLLQSLDTDGQPANGITIPPAAAAAVSSSVNLAQATATFASPANTALTAAMTAGGISRPVTSTASALAHFSTQGTSFLSHNVLVMVDGDEVAMIRFGAGGDYVMGGVEPDDYCGANGQCGQQLISRAGVEAGSYTVQSVTADGYQITVTPSVDTNLQGGLSHPVSCDSGFLPDGDGLIANGTCADSGARLAKATNVPGGIVGVWALGSASSINVQHFVFLPSGKYMMADPIGDAGCGSPGVEYGNYTHDAATGNVTISSVTYDTNGCAGLHDTRQGFPSFRGTFTISADGSTIAVVDPDDANGNVTLYRVSK